MTPRLWQRQPDESPADFTAFAAYLRLKGRRSLRATAEATGRSLGVIRRLSAKFNWSGRVAAFENRLADATQTALDAVIQSAITTSKSDLETFRIKEFLLAHQIIHASHRWLDLATNPRRHQISLTQICRLTELAFKLKCLASGMPFGDEPRRRKRREDQPGYWTAPSAEEALKKMYGSPIPGESPPASAGGPIANGNGGASVPTSRSPIILNPQPSPTAPPKLPSPPVAAGVASVSAIGGPIANGTGGASVPTSRSPITLNPQPSPTASPAPESPPPPRRDAWARWARQQRRRTG